jgi:predicted MFS family arabinose efflux permease
MSNRWLLLAFILLVRIAMGFQYQAVASVAPVLSNDLGLNHAGIGTLIGLYLLPGLFIAIPGGFLGSRFSDLTMISLGVLLMIAGGLVSGAAGSEVVFGAGRLISGAGAVIQGIFVVRTISDRFEGGELMTALGIMLAGFPVGIALSLPILGAVAQSYGWHTAIHLTAAFAAISLVFFIVGYRLNDRREKATYFEPGFRLPGRQLLLICLGAALWAFYNLAYFSFLAFGPALLIERGMSVLDAGTAISLSSWASMFAVPLGGYIAQRSGRPLLIMVGGCMMAGICTLLLPVWHQPYFLSICTGIFGAAPAGVLMAAAIGVLEPRYRAQGNAILYTFFYGGMGFAPGLIGWFADSAGTAAVPVYFSGFVLLLSAALYPVYRRVTVRLQSQAV